MILDISPRISGKTTRAVAWLKEADNRLLLVWSYDTKMEITARFNLEDNVARRVVSWANNEWMPNFPQDTEIFIDDAEFYIQQSIKPFKLGGFSMSNDPYSIGGTMINPTINDEVADE